MKRIIIYLLGFSIALTLVSAAYAVDSGGDVNDPLVTQSYVDSQISQLKTYIDGQIGTLGSSIDSLKSDLAKVQGQTPTAAFDIVSLKNGQQIICDSGAELILRAGYAAAVGSVDGGLADTTSGEDIADGKDVPRNHLLIVPRDDGRGVKATAPNNTIVMIKGTYKIQ